MTMQMALLVYVWWSRRDLKHRPLPNKKQCFLRVIRPFKAIFEHLKCSKTIKFAGNLQENHALLNSKIHLIFEYYQEYGYNSSNR